MNEEFKETIKEKVQKISVRTFTISSCPEATYQQFIRFCEENARNVRYFQDDDGKLHEKVEIIYHVGLRLLLDGWEADAKTMMLYEKIKAMEGRLTLLEQTPQKEEPKRKEIKTFGGNKNE